MARKKLTPNQRLYAEQEQRIKRFIKSAKKRGYEFPDLELPKPKRITKKKIRELEALTPDVLYSKAFYTSKETGETITGTQRRRDERKAAAAKGRRTKEKKAKKGRPPRRSTQIYRFLKRMADDYKYIYSLEKRWVNGGVEISHYGFDLIGYMESKIEEIGVEAFAEFAETRPDLYLMAEVVLYDSNQTAVESNLNAFISAINQAPLSAEQQRQFGTDSDYND